MRLLIYIFESTIRDQKGWVGYTETPDGKVLSPVFETLDAARYYFIGKVSHRCKQVWGYSGYEFIYEDPKDGQPFVVPDDTPFREKVIMFTRGKMATKRKPKPISKCVSLPRPQADDVRIEDIKPTNTDGGCCGSECAQRNGKYLYKKEGNTLIVYEKVLVEKYQLC